MRRSEADHRLAEGGNDGVAHAFRVCLTIETYCRARSRSRSKSRAATALGSTIWLPMPRAQAPAFKNSEAVFRSTPPVGISRTCGSGPRIALKKADPRFSA